MSAASGPLGALDDATLALVGLAGAIALGEEGEIRQRIETAMEAQVPALWVDELLLQSVLMVGWPRTLVAAGLWRKAIGAPAESGSDDLDYHAAREWQRRGEVTCRLVYGENYDKLRRNVNALHPALDAWMITEGYGRTLSRPGLDIKRRELCVIAQTAVLTTPRQLFSHLRGALHAGATPAEVEAVIYSVNPLLEHHDWNAVKELWDTVRDSWELSQ
jgi:4-carboxymuconolactone decarboxylase